MHLWEEMQAAIDAISNTTTIQKLLDNEKKLAGITESAPGNPTI